jgi:PAN domain
MKRTIDDRTTPGRAGAPAPSPRWLGAAVIALGAIATANASHAQTRVQGGVAYSLEAANYWGTELQILSMTDPQACALACDEQPRCVIASFHDATVRGKYNNKCVLRSQPGDRHPENVGVRSWVKGSAPSMPGPASGRCDVRRFDWGNMSYPDFVLRRGSAKTDPGWHIGLQDKDIVYGDLRGDGSRLAFVPIYEGGDVDGTTRIFVVDADPSCAPRLLLTTGGQLNVGGKVLGGGYVFERFNNALNSSEKINVHWVNGRLIETTVTPVPPMPASAPAVQGRVAAQVAPTNTATPPGSPGKMCDLRKVDWANFQIPSGPAFTNGQANSSPWPDDLNCTQSVQYADLDGNGADEAYLYVECGQVMYHTGGACNAPGASCIQQCGAAMFYVFEMGPNCAPRLLGVLDGGPQAKGTIAGQAFIVDLPAHFGTDPPCDSSGHRRVAYRLSNGKFSSAPAK